MSVTEANVAIIGAGPYGLAAAAHLNAAKVETAVFGRTMEFWKNNMPTGMLLRSPWSASNISGPEHLALDDYYKEAGSRRQEPISLERFIDYGAWFQRRAVPQVDERQVVRVEKNGNRFRMTLEDGCMLDARRLIVATGIGSFAHRPRHFVHVPRELVSHAADHRDLQMFAGKTVIVIGAGQSALESAALLHETGAAVEVIARAAQVRWLHRRGLMRHKLNPLRKLLFHPTDVGSPLMTQISGRPEWFKRIPIAWQPWFAYRCIRPAGAAWLRSRVAGIKITSGRSVTSVDPVGSQLSMTLDDGSVRYADHALLATGYRVEISRYKFLAPELLKSIRSYQGYPELTEGLESSVPGLHFLGAPAAWSFGPLMRFVSGTAYAAQALKRLVTAGGKGR